MSLLDEKSAIALKSELDLFELPPTQTAIEQSNYVTFHPLSSSLDGVVEFSITGGEEYLDPSSLFLRVKCKVTKAGGANLAAADKVVPTNYLLHSLWSQVDVFLNEKLISTSNNLYPFKAYIEALLSTTTEYQNSILTPALWDFDEDARKNRVSESKPIELFGRLHLDICFQPKLLINAVDLRIRLSRAKHSFALKTLEAANTNYEIKIDEVQLFVKKVRVSPDVILGHAKVLEKGIPAKYPFNKHELKSFIIPKGLKQYNLDNIINGVLPQRLIFGLVKNEATLGSMTHDSLRFDHFDVNFVSLHVEGRQLPSLPYTPDFSTKNYAREYTGLIESIGRHLDRNHGLAITYDNYSEGLTLFGFDLTPDTSASDDIWSLSQNGTVRLNLNFAKALKEPIALIILAEYQAIITIDQTRTVEIEL